MRKNLLLAMMFTLTVSILSSCEAIGGIFKAGMWVGVIVVVIIVALVLWLIGKVRK
ncbi:MAG: phosphatidate cytidylyltransferase [Segetibacter sp.]|jgi:hypothetical protein|nr:phosphatidate cytidylyltransferase [Segetibacter sp.]